MQPDNIQILLCLFLKQGAESGIPITGRAGDFLSPRILCIILVFLHCATQKSFILFS